MVAAWVPRPGDLVWLSFNPQADREQAGRHAGAAPLALRAKSAREAAKFTTWRPAPGNQRGVDPAGLGLSGSPVQPSVKRVAWRSHARPRAHQCPALILSPTAYNARSGLALACPITSQIKGYPFEVLLPSRLPVAGAILADHVKSLDWRARQAAPAGRVTRATLREVLDKIAPLLGF